MPHLDRKGRRWRVRWREGGRGAKQQCEGFGTKPEALAFAAQLAAKLAAAKPARRHRPIAWAELVERYCGSRKAVTQAHLDQARRTLAALGLRHGWEGGVDAITPANAAGLPAYHRRLLRALLRFAEDLDQQVDRRVYAALRPPPRRSVQHLPLTEKRVAELLARAAEWAPTNGALAGLIADYGHRAQSLVHLTVADLDAQGHRLRFRAKSGDVVWRPITPATAARLAELAKGLPPVAWLLPSHLVDEDGLPSPWASGKQFAEWWAHQVARPRAGEGIVALRKWATTRLYRACQDAKTVAEIQGRRTVGLVLEIYAQSEEGAMRAALAKALPVLPSAPRARRK